MNFKVSKWSTWSNYHQSITWILSLIESLHVKPLLVLLYKCPPSAGASHVFLTHFYQVKFLLDWSSSALLDYQWIIFRKISASQSDHQDLSRNVCFTFTVPQRRSDLPKPSKHLTSSEECLFIHLSISIALHYMFGSFQSHLTKTSYWRYRATTDI